MLHWRYVKCMCCCLGKMVSCGNENAETDIDRINLHKDQDSMNRNLKAENTSVETKVGLHLWNLNVKSVFMCGVEMWIEIKTYIFRNYKFSLLCASSLHATSSGLAGLLMRRSFCIDWYRKSKTNSYTKESENGLSTLWIKVLHRYNKADPWLWCTSEQERLEDRAHG